jgi:hypothetical protein
MKKSILNRWHVKLMLVIIVLLAIFLIIESFLDGYRRGGVIPVLR